MASAILLHILNTVQVVLSMALTAASIWFFLQLQTIIGLRNKNLHRVDFDVSWLQAMPWIFMVVGIFTILVSCCGFAGAKKKNRGTKAMFVIFEGIAVAALVAASAMALTYGKAESTNDFIRDIMREVEDYMKENSALGKDFHIFEERLGCCSPRTLSYYKNVFPSSCCRNDEDCKNLSSEKPDCLNVVTEYSRFFMKVLAGGSALTAFVGVTTIIVAVVLLVTSRKKKSVNQVTTSHEFERQKLTRPQLVIASHELESEKVPL